jgi:hypothetical protein
MTDQPPSPREVIAQTRVRQEYGNEAPVGWAGVSLARNEADEILEALRSRGYVVVPREPTEEMLGAATEGMSGGAKRATKAYQRTVWRAMIDAANPGGGGKG